MNEETLKLENFIDFALNIKGRVCSLKGTWGFAVYCGVDVFLTR